MAVWAVAFVIYTALHHGGRVAKRRVMLSDISNDKLLSATQLLESNDALKNDIRILCT